MAESFDPKPPKRDDDDLASDGGFEHSPYEQEPMPLEEEEAPRRAASARFIVDSEVGSHAALRDAMDPANQSLADALRLSYRVLQAVIVVLIVLFMASGFQTVDEGQTGVKTIFGKIATDEEEGAALKPGPQFSVYPYPIGEFITFSESRSVDVKRAFTPAARYLPREEQLAKASIDNPLMPGYDGSLLTRDGDLAHLDFSAKFVIEKPVDFVEKVSDADVRRDAAALVRLALQRAAIHVVAALSLPDVIEFSDENRDAIRQKAQQTLDGLACGIQLTQVQVHRGYAPLAIESALGDFQAAKVASSEAILNATKTANETLGKVAGPDYHLIIDLIEDYERALEKDDREQAAIALAAINDKFESEAIVGEIANIIQQARSYQSFVESTLGNEYIRFQSLLPTFRENPKLVVTKEWLDVFGKVISRPDTEIIYVHPLMAVRLNLAGSAAIQDIRRKMNVERKQREAMQKHAGDPMGHIQRGSEMIHGRSGRQLQADESGQLRPFGGPR